MHLSLVKIHHVAVICSDYHISKKFYTEILGMHIIQETYRKERDSYKLDLAIGSEYIIELFSFPNPPPRPSHPEACGLRHLSFLVENIKEEVAKLDMAGIPHEQIRTDELTNKEFVFFADPDGLPIELYQF
ncbi:SMU1112c/YaeR family gloxylase I-like metalloprotein [Sphingobacterium spiritivorum]|uniref:SMU1112c/YaeR family gloxylase I-like metalloprotein n=1 Tax=Sphingobacterium spiritivorum TaxID=258 RepID=UPI003DA20C22